MKFTRRAHLLFVSVSNCSHVEEDYSRQDNVCTAENLSNLALLDFLVVSK